MSTTELLTTVSLFQGLTPPEIDRLASATDLATFAPGDLIVETGDPGKSLYVIVEGTVQVVYPTRTSEVELARLGPGGIFGEMALLGDKPRSATVRALTVVRTLRLEHDAFRTMIVDAPELGVRILEVLASRMRAADEQISGLADQSLTDPLTGILNASAFTDRLREECERFRRYGHNFTLLLAEVDHIDEIEANFGTAGAEAAVVWVGRLLREHTRTVDISSRLGGQRFAVLFPCTEGELAHKVAQRLVKLVGEARAPFSGLGGVTLSGGLAICPESGLGSAELFSAARKSLLQAQQAGRNRVYNPFAA